jgi:MFS family permease
MGNGTTVVTDVRGGLAAAWDSVLYFTPKLLAFLLILVVGYFVARALGKVLDRILDRLGFDKMVERGGIKQALSQSGFHVSDILGKVVFYTIFLFVLQLAFGVFGPNPISDLLTRVIAFLPNIFVAIVLVVISAAIAAGVREIVRASIGGLSYGRMLATIASAAIILVGVFAALNQLQIAPQIVNGLFYAILTAIVGVTIVGVGGGLVMPMRARWEGFLNRVETEVPRIQEQVESAKQNQTIPRQSGYVS